MEGTRASADAINSARNNFLNSFTHDLRTPLHAILGLCTVLQTTGTMSSEDSDSIDIISHSGHSLLSLVNSILDVAKVDNGKLMIVRAPFDLHSMLERALSIIIPLANQKQLDLWQRIDNDVPQYVVGDASRIEQILQNLAGNAVKFNRPGGFIGIRVQLVKPQPHDDIAEPRLGLHSAKRHRESSNEVMRSNSPVLRALGLRRRNRSSSESDSSPGSEFESPQVPQGAIGVSNPSPRQRERTIYVRFTVVDSGIGVQDREREKVWSKFEQASEVSTKGLGSGLGLFICKTLCSLMNGTIWMDSKYGQGSSFYLQLPLEVTTQADTEAAATSSSGSGLSSSSPLNSPYFSSRSLSANRRAAISPQEALTSGLLVDKLLLCWTGRFHACIAEHYLTGSGLEVTAIIDENATTTFEYSDKRAASICRSKTLKMKHAFELDWSMVQRSCVNELRKLFRAELIASALARVPSMRSKKR